MTAIDTAGFVPARPAPKLDWWRALKALRRLLRDNDDTAQVFEIMRALNNGSSRRGYARLLSTPAGARLAEERLELATRLMDYAWLDTLPEGSVGAAYRRFVRSEKLSADGLVRISRTGVSQPWLDSADPVAWYGRRVRDAHDLWHVLTGYGRDPLGEASLVAFSYSQTRGLGWLLIALGVLARGGRRVRGVRAAILEGFRLGRRASWLPAVDWEALMRQPLETARAALAVGRPRRYEAVVARVRGLSPERNWESAA